MNEEAWITKENLRQLLHQSISAVCLIHTRFRQISKASRISIEGLFVIRIDPQTHGGISLSHSLRKHILMMPLKEYVVFVILKLRLLKGNLTKSKAPYAKYLRKCIGKVKSSKLSWRDPLANQFLSNEMEMVKQLPKEEYGSFMVRDINDRYHSTLKDLPIGKSAYISKAERQSVASKDRRGERGKRLDMMFIVKHEDKIYELMFAECSRIFCNGTKEEDDKVKLWRELNDGLYWANRGCGLDENEFGILGFQTVFEFVETLLLLRQSNQFISRLISDDVSYYPRLLDIGMGICESGSVAQCVCHITFRQQFLRNRSL
ncbi:hypothetical protein G9A89_006017 [Geosiphon pyriformis]|nr:hypothetical protein G9A89_006017 [Geosiphon pyriformis]